MGIAIIIRGKPLQPGPKENLKAEVQNLLYDEKNFSVPDLKKQIEYYLRGQGYEVLDVQEITEIEV
jgi:hypothetical protein